LCAFVQVRILPSHRYNRNADWLSDLRDLTGAQKLPARMRHEKREGARTFLRLAWLVPLAVLGLLMIAAALALEPFARAQTRKLLDGLDGARARFSEVHVTLFPLRYRITHLKVREVPPKTKEPVLYADELAVHLKWDRLVTGRLVGSV
jgi:hypothetical protein